MQRCGRCQSICTMYDYFDIFLQRMLMCRGAAGVKVSAPCMTILTFSCSVCLCAEVRQVFWEQSSSLQQMEAKYCDLTHKLCRRVAQFLLCRNMTSRPLDVSSAILFMLSAQCCSAQIPDNSNLVASSGLSRAPAPTIMLCGY